MNLKDQNWPLDCYDYYYDYCGAKNAQITDVDTFIC